MVRTGSFLSEEDVKFYPFGRFVFCGCPAELSVRKFGMGVRFFFVLASARSVLRITLFVECCVHAVVSIANVDGVRLDASVCFYEGCSISMELLRFCIVLGGDHSRLSFISWQVYAHGFLVVEV